MKAVTVGLLAAVVFAPLAHGGIMLEGRDDAGGVNVIKIDGSRARVEGGDDSGYMLVHMKEHKVYSVNSDARMVLDVSTAPPASQANPNDTGPSPTVTKVGPGPTIAGYPTIQYRVKVGDVSCFDDYLAPKALQNPEIRDFLQAMADWTARLHGGGTTDEDECDAVADAMNERYPTLGIPMRTVDPAGTVIHEITRIEKDTTFPSSIFELPEGYPVMTQDELLKRMQNMDNQDQPGSPPGQLDEMQQDTQDMLQRLLEQE